MQFSSKSMNGFCVVCTLLQYYRKAFLVQLLYRFVICGIDLAGRKSRPTGICILNDQSHIFTVYTDEEILSAVNQSFDVVAIDAPLSFHGDHFRDCDSELQKEYPILPLTFKGMQMLTQRGIGLASHISSQTIEVYPHASKEVLHITRPEDLILYSITTLPSTIHELDAAVAALTGKYFLEGKYRVYGREDKIIVPVEATPLSNP